MKEKLINMYSLSKTLQFSLIPQGKTEENFNQKKLLEEDERRAEEYAKVKRFIDRYHKQFIERVLNTIQLNNVREYANIYFIDNRSESDAKALTTYENGMRKQIMQAFKKDQEYKDLFNSNIVKKLLPSYLNDEDELKSVEMFSNFFTYFKDFCKNRENMYTEEAQSTAISYRCINDNLPRFLDNVKSFKKIFEALPQNQLDSINSICLETYGIYAKDAFTEDYFSFVLSQSGIDKYNCIIGGYSLEDKTKVQGVNELINLYNQKEAKNDKSKRLPLLKMLYKQILSERESVSFIPEKLHSDDEVISAINSFYVDIKGYIKELSDLFSRFETYDMAGIFVKSGKPITDLSKKVYGDWAFVINSWTSEYSIKFPQKKGQKAEKYLEGVDKAFKNVESFSISDLQRLGNVAEYDAKNSIVVDYYKNTVAELVSSISESYEKVKDVLSVSYSENYRKSLCSNEHIIELIKNLLDSIKSLENELKPLIGTGKESNKDEQFYGDFIHQYDQLSSIDRIYDMVRNYMTRKPYSKEKLKLNFSNPQFLGGWPYTKESDYSSFILRENDKYFLAIMDINSRTVFKNIPKPGSDDDSIDKMYYYQVADPSKDVQNLMVIDGETKKKNGRKDDSGENKLLEELKNQYLPNNINRIRKERSFSTSSANFKREDLNAFIDYYKDRTQEYYKDLKFSFKPSSEYESFADFTSDVNAQAYQLWFEGVSKSFIMDCVERGDLYLFQIYSKDFSEHSHGTPNLHTMFFKAIFDERNLSNVVIKLNGESEMFYRKASIKHDDRIVHVANQAIANKNPDNIKGESCFEYDIIKDRRFTKRQFSIHIPVTLNFKAQEKEFINNEVRQAIKENDSVHIIGIDRGERNLIYISVIDSDGRLIEQLSLNEIVSDKGYKVNYQKLLDKKEKNRDEARKSWNTIENIKELKEGYISQVVHKICALVIKYDAIVAMEDLNFGFKRGRFAVEKQVYQKFENMLISKLNYLCDKSTDIESEGGLLKAYQLTNKYNGVNKGKQNGYIFYVPAWLTSKIDPVTGFAALYHPKYTSVADAQEFISNLDDIRFVEDTNMFEFDIDYNKFPKCNIDFKKRWTVCTNGERIMTFRNPDKNGEWDNKKIILTDEFKKLFEEFGVNYKVELKKSILNISNKGFYERLIKLISLTLQMRNSITGSTDPRDDFLISPVRDKKGEFYDSRDYLDVNNPSLPKDADANGAYNIARKALWSIELLKNTSDDKLSGVNLAITNAEWLKYIQHE